MGVLSIFEKIFDSARIKDSSSPRGNNSAGRDDRSLEKKFYSQMLDYFSELLEERNVGKTILIHSGYIVWLEPSDYESLRDELIAIIPEVIDGFYELLREKSKDFPNSKPGSNEWFFQITPTSYAPLRNPDNGMEEFVNLKKGEMIISSTFHSVNRAWSNVQQSPNVVLSFRPQNSNTAKDLNINKDLLLGIEAIGGTFSQPFDYAKAGLKVSREDVYSRQGFATLKFSIGGQNASYLVKDKMFTVSGSDDKRSQYNVLVIPDDSVVVGHLSFRYRDADDKFEVAAYGHTVLNDRILKLSTVEDTVWHPVSAKASFLLGNGVGIEFIQHKVNNNQPKQ